MEPIKAAKDKSRIIAIWLVSLVSSVAILFALMHQNNYARAQENQFERRRTILERSNLQSDRTRDFYRVIVENNLFRPLGWRTQKQQPEYVLIATWIESRGETAKALLVERSSNRSYYVTLGEKIGKATIETIKPRQVKLNISGEVLTLKVPSIQFLNELSWLLREQPNQTAANTADDIASIRSRQTRVNRDRRNGDGVRQSSPQRLRGRLRNASLEDRRKQIEAIRQQFR